MTFLFPYLLKYSWHIVHLPTHEEHFYDVHRFGLTTVIDVETNGSVHVLSLVEGNAIILETATNQTLFHFVETFVIADAVHQYKLVKGVFAIPLEKVYLKNYSAAYCRMVRLATD